VKSRKTDLVQTKGTGISYRILLISQIIIYLVSIIAKRFEKFASLELIKNRLSFFFKPIILLLLPDRCKKIVENIGDYIIDKKILHAKLLL